MTIDRFVTPCLTTTAYASVFLILKRVYEWYATGYWSWAPMVLGTGVLILLLLNGSLSDLEMLLATYCSRET